MDLARDRLAQDQIAGSDTQRGDPKNLAVCGTNRELRRWRSAEQGVSDVH